MNLQLLDTVLQMIMAAVFGVLRRCWLGCSGTLYLAERNYRQHR